MSAALLQKREIGVDRDPHRPRARLCSSRAACTLCPSFSFLSSHSPHPLLPLSFATQFYERCCEEQKLLPKEALVTQLQKLADEDKPVAALQLKKLDLSNRRDAYTIAELVRANPFLTQLSLQETQLGNAGAAMIIKALLARKTIRTLDLSYNGLERDAFKHVEELVGSCPALVSLDITGNFCNSSLPTLAPLLGRDSVNMALLRMGDCDVDAKGMAALCDGLKANRCLRNLHLGDSVMDVQLIMPLAAVLAADTTLTSLDLRYNALGDQGAASLATALRSNKKLVSLVLWGNEIHEEGIASIGRMLNINKTLKSLDIGLNPIGVEGANSLSAALADGISLSVLGLAQTSLEDEGVQAIGKYLSSDAASSLLRIDLRRNGMKMGAFTVLHEAMQTNKTLCVMALAAPDDPPAEDPKELQLRKAIDEACKTNLKANKEVQARRKAREERAVSVGRQSVVVEVDEQKPETMSYANDDRYG